MKIMAGECPLKVGDKFTSFADVEKEILRLEKHQWITYYRRDSRTICAARKRGLKRDIQMNDRLKFYEAKYACLKGGRLYKSRAKGQRPNQRSFREHCGSFVQFRVSKDGQHLVVVDMSVHHNHPQDKGTFQSLPKQRRLNKEEWQSMNSILAAKPTKRTLQSHIRKSTGKMVTLRDLTNHSGKLKKKPVKLDEMMANDTTAPISPSFADERTMEPSDMYRQAFCEAQKLATMASEVSVAKFKQRLAVLSDLVNLWEMDVEAAVTGISDEVTDSHNILDHIPQPGVFHNSTTCELNSVEDSRFNISVVEDIPSTSGQSSSGLNGRRRQKNVGGEACGLKSKGQVFDR